MEWYNGCSPAQRNRKLQALHREFPGKSHRYFTPPCHVYGDTQATVAPHSEDYSWPPKWERPAMFAVCRTCHGRLHKRFKAPWSWEAYKRHLRRGGYGSDLKGMPREARRVARLAKELQAGKEFPLEPLNSGRPNEVWWESLEPR